MEDRKRKNLGSVLSREQANFLSDRPEGKRIVLRPSPVTSSGVVPLTVKFKVPLAIALRKVSFERKARGVVPNTQQDILEEALREWLRVNEKDALPSAG